MALQCCPWQHNTTMEFGFLYILDVVGTIAFALSGCFVAAEKKADVIGFWLLAIVAGIGGGTIRDLTLGLTPVFWVIDPTSLLICTATAFASYWFLKHGPRLRALVLWTDAAGLAFFAILGASITLSTGAPWFIAVLLGTITGVGGGIIRDLLAGLPTLIMRRDVYASACIIGILIFISTSRGWFGFVLDKPVSAIIAVIAIFIMRGLAIILRLQLRGYGEGRERNPSRRSSD